MAKPKILMQLDPDMHASMFDAVVAVDSGIDHLLQYHSVLPEAVEGLVHGAMFTRGVPDLCSTAIFIGGSNVAAGEALLKRVKQCFFGPMRVSVLLDANGANTTAVAAVLAAVKHVPAAGATATVLAGTGPVGQRVARLLARMGASVRVASRSMEKAVAVCDAIRERIPSAELTPVVTANDSQTAGALEGSQIVVSAGAAKAQLLSLSVRQGANSLKVAIDLNAVPPLGIEGIEVMDKAVEKEGVICYGAIGVGGTKMKIHKAAIAKLFTANNLVLDAEEVLEIGQEITA
ncbi:MAG: NADP-dependent methylenetetrahydromethanopterin/methylenetetrahydrofolate dehydrogenase [Planctomycetaceae bacterium]